MRHEELHVAFLRGINVGGKHVLPMRDLISVFADAGAPGARTYIQSGNVVFGAAPGSASSIAARVEAAIVARFGFAAPLVVLPARALDDALAANPFLARGVDERALHLALLSREPAAAAVAAFDPARSPGDELAIVGRVAYLCLPNGVARTKLTNAWLDRALGVVATVRNLATARAVARLAAELR